MNFILVKEDTENNFMAVTELDIQKYITSLEYFQQMLDKFFEEQSPYIFCKEGCPHCCEKGEYPFSEVEFAYLMIGSRTLPSEVFNQIEQNVFKIKEQKQNHNSDEKFMHACPFLVEGKCSLYDYRGLICRTHGLAFFNEYEKIIVPACVHRGLNYSNVYDFENSTISNEKYKASGIEQEPLAHNVGIHFITKNTYLDSIGLDFGELKPIIDWFEL